MKHILRYFMITLTLMSAMTTRAQFVGDENFAIKASANLGLGNSLTRGYSLPNMKAKSSSSDFVFDFGWTFWRRDVHSLEANIGLGYGHTATTASLSGFDYNNSAPAEADMDDEPYIRFCEVGYIREKICTSWIKMPIYLDYGYRVHPRVILHGLVGFKFGFNVGEKIKSASGNLYSYGVYPQYNDLLIDAPYMNEFGDTELSGPQLRKPDVHSFTASIMTAIGAEVNIYGPVSAELTVNYEGGLCNVFKRSGKNITAFSAENAPIVYTVAGGQQVNPLTNFLTRSQSSCFSLALSVIYRFK